MTDCRDVAAWVETHPCDVRRGVSTVLFPGGLRCKTDANQVLWNALFARAAVDAYMVDTEAS